MAEARPAGAAPEERRERRRLGSLLNAYYGLEAPEQPVGPSASSSSRSPVAPLDREEFNAKKHFDSLVATGQVVDVVRHANEVDSEVRDLDGDMQMVVYENYSKFIRSMEVTKQMKSSLEGLEPDLRSLEGSFLRITEHQRSVEDGVSGRAAEIEGRLKQQRICKKLQLLFDLPATLQRCLNRRAYGRAVQAYSSCAGFLRQHRDVQTLNSVLQDVELQMGRIRSALEQRLRSSELTVEEAVNSSVTLLDLGQDQKQVERDYLSGRKAALRASLDRCFAAPPAAAVAVEAAPVNEDGDPEPETSRFLSACACATTQHVPDLSDTVEGLQKLWKVGEAAATGSAADGDALAGFVSARVQELFEGITRLVEAKCPPLDVLVECITSVRESLQRLHSLLPDLLAKLVTTFTGSIVNTAMKAICSDTALRISSDFAQLHEECRRLQESMSSGLDGLMAEAAKAEQSLTSRSLTALGSCLPLVGLVGSDRTAAHQLARGLQALVMSLLLALPKVTWTCCGHEHQLAPMLPAALYELPAQLTSAFADLDWVGFFGLALVWIGRRWEERVASKVWATAKELLASGGCAGAPELELAPEPTVGKAALASAETAITHFVLVGGQRLAYYLGNSVRNRNWMAAKEPQEPSLVVEMVMKEVNGFDAQLARILGDPRKPRGSSHRRVFNLNKSSMELELERLMAKKMQAFAPIPFSRKGAVAGILRIAFKALYEYVREQTFAKFGLQQIQVDANLFAELVRDFVDAEDASALGSLLGEVVNSASQRCTEPELMAEAAVEALCDDKKRTLRIE